MPSTYPQRKYFFQLFNFQPCTNYLVIKQVSLISMQYRGDTLKRRKRTYCVGIFSNLDFFCVSDILTKFSSLVNMIAASQRSCCASKLSMLYFIFNHAGKIVTTLKAQLTSM